MRESSARFISSPLAHGVVDFIALAAADSDGVKILKGAQPNTWDGHQRRAEAHYNGFCPVESHAQVMIYRNHQWIVPAAQPPVPYNHPAIAKYTAKNYLSHTAWNKRRVWNVMRLGWDWPRGWVCSLVSTSWTVMLCCLWSMSAVPSAARWIMTAAATIGWA